MYGASMNPAVHVTFDVTGRTGDQLCPFPFHFAGVLPFRFLVLSVLLLART